MGDAVTVSPEYMAEDRGKAVIAIFWVQTSLAIVVVAMRFWARYIIKNFGTDDWLMLFTLVCSQISSLIALGLTIAGIIYYIDRIGDLQRLDRWISSFNLPDTSGRSPSCKDQLHQSGLCRIFLHYWQSRGWLPRSSNCWTQCVLAQMGNLYRYGLDSNRRHNQLHIHICPMRPTTSPLGTLDSAYMLGSLCTNQLCHLHLRLGTLSTSAFTRR